jgi:hypothetical protein
MGTGSIFIPFMRSMQIWCTRAVSVWHTSFTSRPRMATTGAFLITDLSRSESVSWR